MLTQEENLLFQSYFTFAFLAELSNNKFLQTQAFNDMKFGAPWIKNELTKIGVDNQGCVLIALYVMLVIPRELIFDKYTREYEEIRVFLESCVGKTSSSYRRDSAGIDYLRHIRNAVAHASVSFRPNEVVVFSDINDRTGENFISELPLKCLGELINRLQKVHLKYIENLQKTE